MGAYYKPVNIDKKQSLCAHNYGSGLKLWEHSWAKNNMLAAVSHLLMNEWKGNKIVWGCDYFEDSPEFTKMYDGVPHDSNPYDWANEIPEDKTPMEEAFPRFYASLDAKQFVDMENIPKDSDGWRPHPLPFLTADEVNTGGGARVNHDPDNIACRWAHHHIIATDDTSELEGFEEVKFTLRENE